MAACENCLISHSYENREVKDLVSNIDIFTATWTSSNVEFYIRSNIKIKEIQIIYYSIAGFNGKMPPLKKRFKDFCSFFTTPLEFAKMNIGYQWIPYYLFQQSFDGNNIYILHKHKNSRSLPLGCYTAI